MSPAVREGLVTALLALSLTGNYLQGKARAALEWDAEYYRAELHKTYEPVGLLDGQCCSPSGEGCNEPILGDDC